MTTEAVSFPLTLDRTAVEAVLPHRAPMLFVERMVALAHDRFLGEVCWPTDHPLLAGHFPGCPIVPGVLLAEAAAQLAGAGLLWADPVARSFGPGHLGMLNAIRKCLFRRPVRGGETVQMELHCRRMGQAAVVATGTARVGGDEAAQFELMLTHVPAEKLRLYLSDEEINALLARR